MNKYVIDTQALVKFLNGRKVINDTINLILKEADAGEHIVIIPSVVIFEIGYLYEKSRIPISIEDIKTILKDSINYMEEKLSIEIIRHYSKEGQECKKYVFAVKRDLRNTAKTHFLRSCFSRPNVFSYFE